MPNYDEITRYKCTKCGAEYLNPDDANACYGRHPGTISVAVNKQTYETFGTMPDILEVTHSNKTYKYHITK